MSVTERTPLVRLTPSIPRSRWKTQFACGAVLLTETMERIAFYGAVGNLVVFLNSDPLDWPSYTASNALLIFTGLSYLTSVFGGWLADAILGRFKTIIIFLVVYIIGYSMLPVVTPHLDITYNQNRTLPEWCDASGSLSRNHSVSLNDKLESTPKPTMTPLAPSSTPLPCGWIIYLGLSIIAIGNGVVKANIAPFGADQVKAQGPVMMRRFFNYFYFCINIGAFISLGGLAFFQQEITWFWGYVIPLACLVLSLIIFICGSCYYIRQPAGGSILRNIVSVICNACRGSCCGRNDTSSPSNSGDETRVMDPPSCLDRAKLQYGGIFHENMVDDVKVLLKICLVFLAMIPYWLVYFQMESMFLVQGLHMRLGLDKHNDTFHWKFYKFHFPAAWLSLFDVIALFFLIPIMDRLVYPFLDRRGYHLSLRIRIAIGMVFSMLAMVAAGVLEFYRYETYWSGHEGVLIQVIGNTTYYAANMSVFFQIPQYTLIGIGEVFSSIAGLELAYSEAPRSMQALIMGLFWFSQGLGSVSGTVFMAAFQGVWFFQKDHGNINCRDVACGHDHRCDCHLDYYFFTLAGVQAIGLALFIIIAWKLTIGARARSRRTPSRLSSSMNGSTSLPRHNSLSQSEEVSPIRAAHIQQRVNSRESNNSDEIT